MSVWKERMSVQSRATIRGFLRRLHKRAMTPRMASLTVTRRLLVKRQVRLIWCLAELSPASCRPMAARETRPTLRVAATSWARVLVWLSRRSVHTVIIQVMACSRRMAVPPQWEQEFSWLLLLYAPKPAEGTASFDKQLQKWGRLRQKMGSLEMMRKLLNLSRGRKGAIFPP